MSLQAYSLVAICALLICAIRAVEGLSCEQARLHCMYREGCLEALENYMRTCDGLNRNHNKGRYCPQECLYSLIALTSTTEGKDLMTCQCSDDFCRDTKLRVDVCRPHVATMHETKVVPCRLAAMICSADQECYTALSYYRRLCQSMFAGRKCSKRCRNSISILRKQHHAAKLNTCKCDGTEDFNCSEIQDNMARMCFHHPHGKNQFPVTSTTIAISNNDETNDIPRIGAISEASRIFPTTLVTLLITLCLIS